MSPAQHEILEAAALCIDAQPGAVDGVSGVGVTREGLGIDDACGEGAADDEGVAHDVPLALRAEEEQQLAQVVDQGGQLHPARLAVAPACFGGLQEVRELRERGVGIGGVDEGVESVRGGQLRA